MLYALVGGGSSTSNLSELLELHPHRESKGSIDFFHMSSGWFDCTEPSQTKVCRVHYAPVRGGSSTANLLEPSLTTSSQREEGI